jgi:hypothetical protein
MLPLANQTSKNFKARIEQRSIRPMLRPADSRMDHRAASLTSCLLPRPMASLDILNDRSGYATILPWPALCATQNYVYINGAFDVWLWPLRVLLAPLCATK